MCALHWTCLKNCCTLHKNGYNYSAKLDSGGIIHYNGFTIKLPEVIAMLKTPELAMPKTYEVTTSATANGRSGRTMKKQKHTSLN